MRVCVSAIRQPQRIKCSCDSSWKNLINILIILLRCCDGMMKTGFSSKRKKTWKELKIAWFMQTRMWRRVIRLKWEFYCYLPFQLHSLVSVCVCVSEREIKFVFLSTLMHGWKYANKKSNNHDKVTQKRTELWEKLECFYMIPTNLFFWQDLKVQFLTLPLLLFSLFFKTRMVSDDVIHFNAEFVYTR